MADEQTPMGIGELVNMISNEFDHLVITRHNEGADKYGPFSFMGKNMYEEAAAELADLCNYARYAYIKLRMLEMQMADAISDAPPEEKLLHGFKAHGE